ncbi:hypothetical protein [Melittangium boletus]|uniref:Uncharacterized protein n=1 Tax=Melittangium boletus DSM 14713 TaxID=1294270 RepID=A0A250IEY8_9BACT|nr:hypothetical protein [Melittangium boletus]ATB30325.1 hypothetical protein MEBOL_003785 [Melittangium boletus DSM 14713]
MSNEQYFCDYCGYNSDSRERCTHCGKYIADLHDNPPQFIPPLWGKLILRLHDGTEAKQIWTELAEIWRAKVEVTRPHKPSQLEQFHTSASTVELYGADYMASIMREALGARGSVEFQELPHEQMPHRPKSQLPRPPTVPRNKR